jgi:hypothetical protein
MRSLQSQSEHEIQTIAVCGEEHHVRIFGELTPGRAEDYFAAAAAVLAEMLTEDDGE